MSKDVTINGLTYNGIESVSINGSVFGEDEASEYTEEVIRRNYSPNGQSFYDTVNINLANGDYVEAKIDMSNQQAGHITFAVGTNITVWPNGQADAIDIMIYKDNSTEGNIFSIAYMKGILKNCTMYRSTNKTIQIPSNNIVIFKITAAGIWINDALVKYSDFTTSQAGSAIHYVLSEWQNVSTLQIGAAQSDNDYSYATYEYIKVFRKN